MSKLISIGTLIDTSWDLYRARFHELLSVSGWLLLIAIFFTLSLALYPSASDLWFSNQLSFLENTGVLLYLATYYVLAPLLGLWVAIALSRMVKAYLTGRGFSTGLALSETKPRFLPTLLVTVMVVLLLVLATLIGFGPSIILASLGVLFKTASLVVIGNVLLLIGILVALVLAFKWMVEYYLSPYATMLDGARGKQALSVSRQLVQGHFWETLLRLVVPKLVFILFGIFLMAIIAYVTEILLNAAGGLNLDLRLRLATLIQTTVPVVIGVLINPLIIIADILLYKNLKGD